MYENMRLFICIVVTLVLVLSNGCGKVAKTSPPKFQAGDMVTLKVSGTNAQVIRKYLLCCPGIYNGAFVSQYLIRANVKTTHVETPLLEGRGHIKNKMTEEMIVCEFEIEPMEK